MHKIARMLLAASAAGAPSPFAGPVSAQTAEPSPPSDPTSLIAGPDTILQARTGSRGPHRGGTLPGSRVESSGGSGNFNGNGNSGSFNGNGNSGSFNGNRNTGNGNGNGFASDGNGNGSD